MIAPHFADMADAADRIHPLEFAQAIADRYEFATPIGAITYDEFMVLIGDEETGPAKTDRFIVQEEVQAFAAYLRAVQRSRILFRKLAARLEASDGPA